MSKNKNDIRGVVQPVEHRVLIPDVVGSIPTSPSIEMIRASGDVVCEICGRKYYDHPMDEEQLSYDGRPFLHIGCDGKRLKL